MHLSRRTEDTKEQGKQIKPEVLVQQKNRKKAKRSFVNKEIAQNTGVL